MVWSRGDLEPRQGEPPNKDQQAPVALRDLEAQ